MLNVSENGYISLTRGDTARLTVSVTDDVSGEPYELQNGDTLTLSVKKSIKDVDPVLSKTIENTDTFHIEPKDTAGLSFGKYMYDVQLTMSDGDVYTIIPPSTFEILTEVTS